ncbi:MAG: GNAT family N-acetyltransferase, partial [Chloroflexi bacterium]|nr:GNAT family N-acetyltransferase [Chloroflexota bacterium]
MTFPIRPIEPAEFDEYRKALARGFNSHPNPKDAEPMRKRFEFDRSLAAFDDGQIVGTATAFSYAMAVPGGATPPTAGVTMVTVLSTHRRRGILPEMMRRQLSDIRERGEPLAALWASESIIYGRFGYGVGTYSERWSIDRSRA